VFVGRQRFLLASGDEVLVALAQVFRQALLDALQQGRLVGAEVRSPALGPESQDRSTNWSSSAGLNWRTAFSNS
jgi:hypothetical protein